MDDEKQETYRVVVNHEEQYSIWPERKEVPMGWVAVGPTGSKEECLDYVEYVWTDMRPRSLRFATQDASAEERMPSDEDALPAELEAALDRTLSEHDDRIREYAEGRPELFGWFLARVIEAMWDEEVDPNTVRAHLNDRLPVPSVPDDYA